MQRDKTIQFWDDYHDENDSEEWISKPGEELLHMIYEQIHNNSNNGATPKFGNSRKRQFSILEIGCGTSTLIRDLKRHIEERDPLIEVVAYGTDVSEVCIDSNKERDSLDEESSLAGQEDSDKDNIVGNARKSRGILRYEVLNVLEGEPSLRDWDLIIDKGCLDTFLFRSRQRGTQNKAYPKSVRILLDKLHGWQSTEATKDHELNDNYQEGEKQQGQQPRDMPSVYVCITPRQKFKALRDYAGFSSVKRYPLPGIHRSKLEGRKRNDNIIEKQVGGGCDDNEKNGSKLAEKSPGFMFVCTKNNDYRVGVSTPFPSASRKLQSENLPSDENQCPHCHITFREFRSEEGLKSRGVAHYTRKWKAHCIHCKSDPIRTN